jgi:hypothetical protein
MEQTLAEQVAVLAEFAAALDDAGRNHLEGPIRQACTLHHREDLPR